MDPETGSLYERLGGEAAVELAVERLYRKVLLDPTISGFFDGVDMIEQSDRLRKFLVFVFGGPTRYTDLDLTRGHARLTARGLNDNHFDAVLSHLKATLSEIGIAETLTLEVLALTETTRNPVLGRAP